MNKFMYRYLSYLGIYSLVAFAGWQLGTLLGSHAISFVVSLWFGIGLCYLEQHCDLRPRPLYTADWIKMMWLGLFWPLVIQPDVVMEERGPHIDA